MTISPEGAYKLADELFEELCKGEPKEKPKLLIQLTQDGVLCVYSDIDIDVRIQDYWAAFEAFPIEQRHVDSNGDSYVMYPVQVVHDAEPFEI